MRQLYIYERLNVYADCSYLIIGLGSMGKRRHRCLKALGVKSVYGFDLREDRRREAQELGILDAPDPLKFLSENPNSFVFICVPPNHHQAYMELSLEYKSNFFVEAAVIDHGHDLVIQKLKDNPNLVGVPSCTLLFHPAIKLIDSECKSGALGRISSIIYHSGQYLPDWHPDEPVEEYYVCNPETGAAREIVPFELTWLAKLFGMPKVLGGTKAKTIDIRGAEDIDDTYMAILKFEEIVCSLTVDVVSRAATRRILINGSRQQLRWNWDKDCIDVYCSASKRWIEKSYTKSSHQVGYSPNIPEQMYIDEVRSFLDSVINKSKYPTDFNFDKKILSILTEIENQSLEG